jgi:choline transport protein
MGFLAAAVVVVLLNITFFAYYEHLMSFMVFYVNFVVLSTFITLLVRAHPKRSAYTVFLDLVNETGWSSNGWVFLLGLLPGITGINGFDAAAHMTDELPNPARQVPQVMLGSATLSAVLALRRKSARLLLHGWQRQKPSR